jgi:Fe-S cluster assembly protein SufD
MITEKLKNFLPKSGSEQWKYIDFDRYDFDIFTPTASPQGSQNANVIANTANPQWLFESLKPLLPLPSLNDAEYSQLWLLYNGYLIKAFEPMGFKINNIPPNPENKDKLTGLPALNQAFSTEGSYLILPQNTLVDKPIYIINITDTKETPRMVHPKTHIKLEAHSQASVIEVHLSLGERPSFTNAFTQIELATNASLKHIILQKVQAEGLLLSDLQVNLAENSTYQTTTLALGGKLNRQTAQIELTGSRAKCEYFALLFGREKEQIDIHLNMQHQKSHCQSHTLTRGVMAKRARGSFTGKMVIAEGAEQTTATLENKNLLLSADAEVNTRPELEVYNNDVVQCTHGATVGHLDLDALFYLKSRGIPENEARQLLIDGFINPSLKALPDVFFTYLKEFIHEH